MNPFVISFDSQDTRALGKLNITFKDHGSMAITDAFLQMCIRVVVLQLKKSE